jgi:hypothetical protein
VADDAYLATFYDDIVGDRPLRSVPPVVPVVTVVRAELRSPDSEPRRPRQNAMRCLAA